MSGRKYCERYSAHVYDRGGMQRLGTLGQVTQIQWARQRDDTSFASATIEMPDPRCQDLLSQVHANRHELVVFDGNDRVWEGPISLYSTWRNGAAIEARDVSYYAFRTVNRNGRNSFATGAAETVIDRARGILQQLARKEALSPPINVLPYVRWYKTPGDALTAKKTRAHETTVYDDLDSMAMRLGLDYTVIGRSIILFDTHTVWGTTRPVTQDDFLSDVIITEYGLEGATHGYATSFEGLTGFADANANDPYFGEWEVVDGAYNEEGTQAPTAAALKSQANRNIYGRNPVPVHIRVPQNATLSPTSALRIQDLVPGIRIPLTATNFARSVEEIQKLDSMKVTEKGGSTPTVQVSMSPASLSDEEATEEGTG